MYFVNSDTVLATNNMMITAPNRAIGAAAPAYNTMNGRVKTTLTAGPMWVTPWNKTSPRFNLPLSKPVVSHEDDITTSPQFEFTDVNSSSTTIGSEVTAQDCLCQGSRSTTLNTASSTSRKLLTGMSTTLDRSSEDMWSEA